MIITAPTTIVIVGDLTRINWSGGRYSPLLSNIVPPEFGYCPPRQEQNPRAYLRTRGANPYSAALRTPVIGGCPALLPGIRASRFHGRRNWCARHTLPGFREVIRGLLRTHLECGRITGQFGSYLLCREQPPNPPAERPGERGTQELGLIRPVAGRGNSAPSPSANLAGVRGSRWCSWSRPISGPRVGPASPCRQVHLRRMPTMRALYSRVSLAHGSARWGRPSQRLSAPAHPR